MFYFGDANHMQDHLCFQGGMTNELKNAWSWPIQQVMSILNLDGKITMAIPDAGAMQITVDSGIAQYNYIYYPHKQNKSLSRQNMDKVYPTDNLTNKQKDYATFPWL